MLKPVPCRRCIGSQETIYNVIASVKPIDFSDAFEREREHSACRKRARCSRSTSIDLTSDANDHFAADRAVAATTNERTKMNNRWRENERSLPAAIAAATRHRSSSCPWTSRRCTIESTELSFRTWNISSIDRPNIAFDFPGWCDIRPRTRIAMNPTINRRCLSRSKRRDKLTVGRSALRRKNALQDMQVITSKFNPRAKSPQIRQTKVERNTRRVVMDRLSVEAAVLLNEVVSSSSTREVLGSGSTLFPSVENFLMKKKLREREKHGKVVTCALWSTTRWKSSSINERIVWT